MPLTQASNTKVLHRSSYQAAKPRTLFSQIVITQNLFQSSNLVFNYLCMLFLLYSLHFQVVKSELTSQVHKQDFNRVEVCVIVHLNKSLLLIWLDNMSYLDAKILRIIFIPAFS